MVALKTLDELKDWKAFRAFTKERLKQLSPDGERIFVARTDLEFDLGDKSWSGRPFLFGEKGAQAAQRFKKEGVRLLEGTCRLDGRRLVVEGLPAVHVKKARLTMKKLVLGVELAPASGEGSDVADEEGAQPATERRDGAPGAAAVEAEDTAASAEAADADGGDLRRRAARIEKGVEVWRVTERIATQQLRKLQKAVLDLGLDASAPVVRGLERIRTRLERIDDVALAAARAAEAGDAVAFGAARDRLRRKLVKMQEYVRSDPLIADADSNPMIQVQLAETLGKSLSKLLRFV